MKYTILINQKAIKDNGWIGIVKASHIAVLEAIVSYIGSRHVKKITDWQGEWFWVSNKVISEELPMFEIKESRVKQIIFDLCEVGLLEKNPNNESLAKMFLRKGYNYHLLESDGQISDPVKNLTGTQTENYQAPCQNIVYDPAKILTPNQTINQTTNSKTIKQQERDEMLKSFCLSKPMTDAWNLWVEYKKTELKESYKEIKYEVIALKKWLRLSNGVESEAVMIIDESIAARWKGLFALKQKWGQPVRRDQTGGYNVGENLDYSNMKKTV